jgi:alkylated DNA repair dioxygenase AlkB
VPSTADRPEVEYVPGWLDATLASDALGELERATPWRDDTITMFGATHPVPRRTALYGDPGAVYTYSRIRMEPLPWTPLLAMWRTDLEEHTGASFNSVLLNWYRDGRDANGWHADDEPELGREPIIASLSLGATRRMAFKRRDGSATWRVDLAHGDLVVMRGRSQADWLHTIARTARPVGSRINLTYRLVRVRG